MFKFKIWPFLTQVVNIAWFALSSVASVSRQNVAGSSSTGWPPRKQDLIRRCSFCRIFALWFSFTVVQYLNLAKGSESDHNFHGVPVPLLLQYHNGKFGLSTHGESSVSDENTLEHVRECMCCIRDVMILNSAKKRALSGGRHPSWLKFTTASTTALPRITCKYSTNGIADAPIAG